MTRRTIIVCLVAIAGLASSRHARTSAQQTTFRARTDVVSVAVSVTKGRNPVTGLTPADFDLSDNGVRQTVDGASLDSVPIDMTLVITAFSRVHAEDHYGNLFSAAATRALLRSEDRLRVVTIDDDIRGSEVANDYSLVADPVVRSWQEKNGWGVALADGLFYALAWPVEPTRRHLVVAFTDGWDTASALEMDTLPQLAAHSDAVLHAVFWRTPGDDNQSGGGRNIFGAGGGLPAAFTQKWKTSFNTMDAVVERTGGTLQRSTRASEALAEIVADFRSSYVLRYTPRGVPLAGWHELKVKITRPGSFTIRARKGYEGS